MAPEPAAGQAARGNHPQRPAGLLGATAGIEDNVTAVAFTQLLRHHGPWVTQSSVIQRRKRRYHSPLCRVRQKCTMAVGFDGMFGPDSR